MVNVLVYSEYCAILKMFAAYFLCHFIEPRYFLQRGLITWLLSCVDQRVFAASPIVYDLLNVWEVCYKIPGSCNSFTYTCGIVSKLSVESPCFQR